MLKISVHIGNKIVTLPPLQPGDRGGSMTDYTLPGTEVILFWNLKSGVAKIMKSPEGISIEEGDLRLTIPFQGLRVLKELARGQKFELPFTAKQGKAIIHFECV